MSGKPVTASVECLDTKGLPALEKIELAARICYNSDGKAKPGKAAEFLRGQILSKGHESVIEHEGQAFLVNGVGINGVLRLLTNWPGTPYFQVSVLGEQRSWEDKGRCDLIVSGDFRAFRDFWKYSDYDLGGEMLTHLVKQIPLMGYGLEPAEGDWNEAFEPGIVIPLGFQSTLALNEWQQNDENTLGFCMSKAARMKHGTLSFRIDGVSRALTHQLVRHRPVAYSQRSQRYCGEDGFNYVVPPRMQNGIRAQAFDDCDTTTGQELLGNTMEHLAAVYGALQEPFKQKNEDARFVLPNACETNIVSTATLNQWKHMINLRTSFHAQWEIRGVFQQIHKQICAACPGLGFEEIKFETEEQS